MKTNIDKKAFNKDFAYYLNLPKEEQERYYTKHIHKYILIIIHNVLYTYRFDDINLLKEDVAADLVCHLFYKQDKIAAYQSTYNALFTLFRNRLYDIFRSYRRKQDRLDTLIELRNEYLELVLSRGEEIELDADGE